jgi:hypothetical protein
MYLGVNYHGVSLSSISTGVILYYRRFAVKSVWDVAGHRTILGASQPGRTFSYEVMCNRIELGKENGKATPMCVGVAFHQNLPVIPGD